MTTQDKATIGKKGEILPKKSLREVAGIKPGDKVIIEAYPGKLIINKIYSVEELLEMPIISKGTPEEIKKEIEKVAQLQEKITNEEY